MLPIEYEGEEKEFETRLVRKGYVCKFFINVDNKEFIFEADEEGNIRALLEGAVDSMSRKDIGILKAIADNLQKIVG
jgi:hypothetical protein